jgi:hypothetical protein
MVFGQFLAWAPGLLWLVREEQKIKVYKGFINHSLLYIMISAFIGIISAYNSIISAYNGFWSIFGLAPRITLVS